ncbi:hypothetical protein [Hymenobacter nivis]|uniref:hypothetical protein n=1 Tax=Hymenobacter nivis TaxID=1850093 RepID=UPI001375B6A4|nr:hypothetical protein [Hymenobacter nivis]
MISILLPALQFVARHWKWAALVMLVALVASLGIYEVGLLQRHVLSKQAAGLVQHHITAVAADARAQARADSAAHYNAGQRAELLRNASLLRTEDEKLTAQRPAPYELPADPPRE